jgi:hypothetical protein
MIERILHYINVNNKVFFDSNELWRLSNYNLYLIKKPFQPFNIKGVSFKDNTLLINIKSNEYHDKHHYQKPIKDVIEISYDEEWYKLESDDMKYLLSIKALKLIKNINW